jgi:alkylhydroperoxidase/carboxymuconolactone decarboxylase family protein YurZ
MSVAFEGIQPAACPVALGEVEAAAPAPDAVDFVAAFLNRGHAPGAAGLKFRPLAGLAAVTALRVHSPEIKAHVRAALEAGASHDEVVAAIVEASLYSGFAAAHAGLDAAFAVFNETAA